jgi:hypothetical protein
MLNLSNFLFIGLVFSFASNLIPHSDVITPFYIECLKIFHDYSDKNDFVFGNISTKILYHLLDL